jgi:signal transduction histidine kinase
MFGQATLLIAAALLIAQVIGFFVLVNERDRWRLLDTLTPAIVRFAEVAHDVSDARPENRMAVAFRAGSFDRHFIVLSVDGVAARHMPRQSNLATQLRAALAKAGVAVSTVDASSRGFADSPHRPEYLPPRDQRGFAFPGYPSSRRDGLPDSGFAPPPDGRPPGDPMHLPEFQEINLAARLPNGSWLNADFRYPPPPQNFVTRLVAAEIVLYLAVLSASLFFAARVIRPLNELANTASRFGGDRIDPIAVRGPREVRAAVSSFNAMAQRVSDLLREKDHMIAAIGHDLRTPLAALRVRAEAIEPEAERERMIESLDDLSKMVEDILSLARPRASEPFVVVDLSALADSVVEEFGELGKAVTFTDAPRTTLPMQPTAVKRLIRNLIENAIKFGHRADVSIETEPGSVSLCVDDQGPGIPEALLAHVKEAFVRLEESRSRETGGIGLGLAIATAIAHSQNAQLDLINRPEGGLRARVRWSV